MDIRWSSDRNLSEMASSSLGNFLLIFDKVFIMFPYYPIILRVAVPVSAQLDHSRIILRAVGLAGYLCDFHPPRANVNEEEDVIGHLAEPVQTSLLKKSQAQSVLICRLKKRSQSPLGPVRAGVEAVLDQYLLDRIGCDDDPKFLEFALDGRTPRRANWFFRPDLLFTPLIAHPSKEGLIMDDRKKLLDGIPLGRAQANEERPLSRSGLDLLRQSGTEDCILGFQVSDLAQEDCLRQMNQENEKRMLAGGGHEESAKKDPQSGSFRI